MKIICIAINYPSHAKELKNKIPEKPVFFLKPETALLPKKHPFYYPDFTNKLDYECELVLRISRLGKHIDERFAHKYYDAITLGIDFTARDIQNDCKQKGLPWEKAKAFDFSAPVSNIFLPVSKLDINNISFSLLKNNEKVQYANSKNMIFSFNYIVSYISKFITLKIGDLIFTGTPEGVGQVHKGDILTGFIENKKMIEIKIK